MASSFVPALAEVSELDIARGARRSIWAFKLDRGGERDVSGSVLMVKSVVWSCVPRPDAFALLCSVALQRLAELNPLMRRT